MALYDLYEDIGATSKFLSLSLIVMYFGLVDNCTFWDIGSLFERVCMAIKYRECELNELEYS